jgi:5'-phosphate synthase pdxT subunit
MLHAAAAELGVEIQVVPIRTAGDLTGVSGIILPGGESTTISRLLRSSGIQPIVLARAGKDLAIFGTCAGMILLAQRATHDVEDKDIQLLGLLDAEVDRNAFGRQKDSFEAMLDVEGIGEMPAVFIRAPAYNVVSGQVLARFDKKIIAAENGLVMATAFHPELTPDTRLHQRFLGLCKQASAG